MDSKEVKSLLKQAREAIRNKQHKDALKHCKTILKHDKENYNALVFVGVAAEGMEQVDQAVMAYKKATAVDSNQPLAWQGLCNLYEKSVVAEHKQDLASVYTTLIQLHTSDEKRREDLMYKQAVLYRELDDKDKAIETCQNLLKSPTDETRTHESVLLMTQIIESLPPGNSYLMMLRECYERLLLVDEHKLNPDLWSKYLNLLIQISADTDTLWRRCSDAVETGTSVMLACQLLCAVYCDRSILRPLERETILPYLERLTDTSSQPAAEAAAAVVRGYWDLQDNQFSQAALKLKQAVDKSSSVSGWFYLSQCYVAMHQYEAAMSAIKSARRMLKSASVCFHGDRDAVEGELFLLEAWLHVQSASEDCLKKAEALVKQVLERYPSHHAAKGILIRALIGRGDTERAEKVLHEYKKEQEGDTAVDCLLHALIHKAHGDLESTKESLQKAVKIDSRDGEAWRELSEVYWQQGDRQACFTALLQSAKLDPHESRTFVGLGRYYKEAISDYGKASRCFKKAFELNPSSDDAGVGLVDCLNAAGDKDGSMQILIRITKNAVPGSCKWAWLRIGLLHLEHDDPTQSVISLQAALRADPSDRHCWEVLGEAYLAQGSYTAAVKAFTKATQIDDSALYSFYRIGTIKHALAQYLEAVEEFSQLLQRTPDYVPALKGMGEAYLEEARCVIKEGLHGRALDYCQLAITALSQAVLHNTELVCVWKLLADTCVLIHTQPAHKIKVSVPSQLLAAGSGQLGSTLLDKQAVVTLAVRCYGMALKRQPENSCLWHDLGLTYYSQLQQLSASDKTAVASLANKCVEALQQAVTLDPNNKLHWNALGVVASSPYVDHPSLAQHCFIKSIQLEYNNVVAWTNLGALYLKHDNIKLAHEAFKVAQSVEPSYVSCWLGQALVADMLAPDEAMDLYRHSCELSSTHPLAALGYASWVCRTIQKQAVGEEVMSPSLYNYVINEMAAVPAAIDALTIYTDRVPDNAVAFNLLGILLEKQSLYKNAVSAFSLAVKLLEAGCEKFTDARENLARALRSSGQCDEAVKLYEQLPRSFTTLCGLALTLYTNNNHTQAIRAYEAALELSPSEADESHVHAALGMVKYSAEMPDDAKTSLFTSCQSKCPSDAGLKALLAMALLAGDMTLASAVMKEMTKTNSRSVQLSAAAQALQNDIPAGRRCCIKAIHRDPADWRSWHHLAKYLQQHEPACADLSHACCIRASLLTPHADTERQLTGVMAALLINKQDILRLAQKSVHTHPASLDCWSSLLCAAYTCGVISPDETTTLRPLLLSLSAHIMAWVEADLSERSRGKRRLRSLHVWSVCQYVMSLLSSDMTEQAMQFLKQAAWLYDDDVRLQALTAFFERNTSVLTSLTQNDTSGCILQLLAELYRTNGLNQDVVTCYKHLAAQARSAQERNSALVLLAHHSLSLIQAGGDVDSLYPVISECSQMILKNGEVTSTSIAAQLIQGTAALTCNNAKQAKRSLNYVINHNQTNICGAHATCLANQALQASDTTKRKEKEPEVKLVDENDRFFLDG